MDRYRRITLLTAGVVAGLATTQLVAPAFASTAPLSQVREVAHFDISALQQPENITLGPDGAAYVTFTRARQIARVTPDGRTSILATLPAPASGTAALSGIVRDADGTLYVNYNAGRFSGLWRIRPGGTPEQVAALPDVKLNGLALDERNNTLYATDSTTGTVWKVSPSNGTASVWADGEALKPFTGQPSSGFGANGIKVHDGAVWVSNTDKGTLLRIPIGPRGNAGEVTTQAEGLTSIDDFAFVGPGDTILAAQNFANAVALVNPDGTHSTVLTAEDGVSNPTSLAVRGRTVYVASGAYFTRNDPNLLLAHDADEPDHQ
jgi:sugar lactone lactonase YvrE